MHRSLVLATTLVLVLASTALACLWDRDTPQDEAIGIPEVVAVLTGRFERNPPLYYEMRLTRVRERLQDHPEELAAYDDAGVACDRLGRSDEAVSWMEQKRRQMETRELPESERREQLYRYHANLGTFIVHRWFRNGADRTKLAEVEDARRHIAGAIAINPGAHFGREKYQLRILDWILQPWEMSASEKQTRDELPNLLGWSFQDIYGENTEPGEAREAVQGLAGLVVLGNAWESVDVFHALNVALQRDSIGFERGREGGRNTLAYFAWLRCRELIDSGRRSILPGAPTGKSLKAMLPAPDFDKPELLLDGEFARLRAEADAWHVARTEFMLGRLKTERHPDTDPDFWDGYVATPAPKLAAQSVPGAYQARVESIRRKSLAIFVIVLLLIAGFGGWLSWRAWVRGKSKPTDASLRTNAG